MEPSKKMTYIVRLQWSELEILENTELLKANVAIAMTH